MKHFFIFVCIVFILFFFSCHQKREKVTEQKPAESAWLAEGKGLFSVEFTPLPITQDDLKLVQESDIIVSSQEIMDYFPDSFPLSSSAKIVRIPDQLGFLLFLVLRPDDQGSETTDLCCFSSALEFQDNLRVFSRDSVPGSPEFIYQTYRIDEDGIIRTTKQLAGVLIEELYYQLNAEGHFEEIRDGETPVVAFESFDHMTYFIESFVWNYDANGGLYKENLVKTSYRLVNGEMQPTE